MDRSEAVSLLRELVSRNLVQLSPMSIEKNQKGTFELLLKANCDLQEITKLVAPRNLVAEENADGYCLIYKP